MKKIKKILIVCIILAFTASCETYKDYEIEYSPIYPLCGEWMVRFTDTSVTPSVSGLFLLSTYNTENNSTDKMWIKITSTSSSAANIAYTGRFTGKVNCDITANTFSGENVSNTYYTTGTIPTFTITAGTIVKDGYDTATGGKSDKISFTITDTRKPGKTKTVTGFRRTRWYDDEV